MGDGDDFFAKRVVFKLPGMERASVRRDIVYKPDPELRFDLYLPEGTPSQDHVPSVILVHGDGPPEILANAKDWGVFVSLGRLIAASGLCAVAFNHRSSELRAMAGRQSSTIRTKLTEAAQDVDDLFAYVRAHHQELQVDPERLALWVFSLGPPVGLRTALRIRPTYIRCIIAYYGIMNLAPLRDEIAPDVPDDVLREFSPLELLAVSEGPVPPMLIARAGLEERPWLNPTIDRFVAEALERDLEIDVLNHPSGYHAFDVLNDDDRSRDILARTLQFVGRHLSRS
jgi:dienelactone hydrolase